MIPLTTSICQDVSLIKAHKNDRWQSALAKAYRDPETLLSAINLRPEQIPDGISNQNNFPLRVPHSYVARMKPGDPNDPLLLQVLSRQIELSEQSDYLQDPTGEISATASPGLLHKYRGRVLLITTSACPIHCRYCFRRHYPYSENRPENGDWSKAIDYIASDTSIKEVILSGGDPLSLSNKRLQSISDQLKAISHIKRLRIHTRMPIVLPERVDTGFRKWLDNLPWQTIVVIHCNHANEIDMQVSQVIQYMISAGATLLNQSVLLKGVNDNAIALINLSEALFETGTLPYYLHQLDHVIGSAHFEVQDSKAISLMEEIQCHLPGFLIPRLVREIAGKMHKIHLPASAQYPPGA